MAVRIYGKTINTWKSWESYTWKGETMEREIITQYEIEYKEYDENGNLVATGTEDFSRERYMQIVTQWVWIWDGEKQTLFDYAIVGECLRTLSEIKDKTYLTICTSVANWFKRNGFNVSLDGNKINYVISL